MALIDINMTAENVEKEAATSGGNKPYPTIPAGDYELVIADTKEAFAKNNRPMLKVRLEVMNHEAHNGHVLWYNCPLPWINENGEHDNSGIGFLANLMKGCGLSWEGTTLDTERMHGACCRAAVTVKDRVRGGQPVVAEDGSPVKDNEITRIYT